MSPASVRIAAGVTAKRNSSPYQVIGATRSAPWARERTTTWAMAYSEALSMSCAA